MAITEGDIGSISKDIQAGKPVGNDPTWNLVKSYIDTFGRAPSVTEFNAALPAYELGSTQGNAFVSQLYQNQENTPDKIAKANQDRYLKEAPKHFDTVNQQFQNLYGRAASQDELNHFGSLLASGTTDAYGLQQFLQNQPEYQTKQNEQFQTGLSGKLAGYDKEYFQNQILPSIQEAYAKQGRSFDSSAFQGAASQAAQQQNVQRQQYLAGLSAQQYGGVQDRAYQDYADQIANQRSLTNAGIDAQYQGMLRAQDRSNQISDFNTQQQLYNQYLARYGKRGNGIRGALQGAIGGATVGAQAGGPWGAVIGGIAGGGLGYAGSQGGSY